MTPVSSCLKDCLRHVSRAVLPGTTVLLFFSGPASGQDLSRGLALADRTFETGILPEGFLDYLDPTLGGTLKGDFGYAFTLGVAYDSNVTLRPSNEEGDFIFTLNPSIFYTSDPEGGARNVVTAYYSPQPQFFQGAQQRGRFNRGGAVQGDRGRFNQNAGGAYRFRGARTSINAFVDFNQTSAPDRLTNNYAEVTLLSIGMRAEYQLAPRTLAYFSLSRAETSFESAAQQGGEFVTGRLGAGWLATARLRIGPELRYQWSDSVNAGVRRSIAGLFAVRYEVSELIGLNAAVGLETIRQGTSGGYASPSPAGSLGFRYAFSPLWSWTGTVTYANVPSPESFGFVVNDLLIRTVLGRSLGPSGTLGVFGSFGHSDIEGLTPATRDRSTTNRFYEIGLRYRRPFFSERVTFESNLSHLRSTGQREWSKWIVSLAWRVNF